MRARPPKAKRSGTGQAWESKLEAMHEHYATLGVTVERVVPPFRVIRRNADGSLTIRFVGAGAPDYLAFVGGKVVRFDAKSLLADRFKLVVISPEQAGSLTRCDRAGGLAGLVVQLTTGTWWVSWSDIAEMWRAWKEGSGIASIPTERMDEVGLRIDGADWLPVVGMLTIARDVTTGVR